GQALGQPRPGLAAVVGLVDAGLVPKLDPRRGAGEGVAAEGIGAGVEDLRVGRVDGQVGGAGGVIDEQHLFPGLAGVGGLEDAALGVGPPGVAQGGDVNDVGVLGVNDDPADVPGVPQ